MPKDLFKRYLPDHDKLREKKHLRVFHRLLQDPYLFHLNRHSVAGAFVIGMFMAFIPIPFQMPVAGALAVLIRVNFPLAVSLVWITNPITMAPIFFFCYKVGLAALGMSPDTFNFELSWEWLKSDFTQIWQPFLLGCLIMSSICSLLSYIIIQNAWRIIVRKRWHKRRLQRQLNQKNASS